jgi:hypothetical protein
MWHLNYKSWGIWDAIKEFVRVTPEQMVKQDVFSAVLEVCILTYLHSCECKFVTIFLFVSFSQSIWVYLVLTHKIFALHWGQNGKGAHFIHPTGLAHPSCQIVSQKLTVFHLIQTAISPGSHLLASTVTLTSIPLLSRKYTRS